MITKENYLDWFLLYVDNELDNDQKILVEQFVAANPELNDEFAALQETVLPADNFTQNWDNLIKTETIEKKNWEEQMLLHLDKELNENEQINLQKHLDIDLDDLQKWNELQQTVLPVESVIYPNKSELLRKENGRIIPIWIKVASIAAALLLVCFTVFQWKNSDRTTEIAVNTIPKKQIPKIEDSNINNKDSNKLKPKIEIIPKRNEPILASNKKEKKITKPTEKIILAKDKSIGDPLDQISMDDHWKKSEQLALAKVDIDSKPAKNDIPNVIAANKKIELVNLPEKNNASATKSSKRMIFAADFNDDDEVYVANTSISTKKILKFFKGKKEEDKKATQTNHL